MGENIENMINVLETDIEILKDKIKYNELKGGKSMLINKPLQEIMKKRNLILRDLYFKINEEIEILEKYLDLTKEEEDMEIDKILIENAEKINKITKLVPTDLKAGEKIVKECPNCGAKLTILRESLNGHLWIVCEKEGVLFCE